MDLALLESLHQAGHLNVDDLRDVATSQRVEEDDFVHAVQELRPEVGAQRVHHLPARAFSEHTGLERRMLRDELAAEVRGHDDHGVLEVDRAAFAVGQPPVVQQLEQHVQYLGMGLLDFIEEHHRVGAPPHRFGELTRFLVADVAGRRANHARDGVLLLVLRHVDPHHRLLVVEQEFGEGASELGLPDTGRTEEQEAAERTVGILQAGARAPDGVRHRNDGLVLTDDSLVQACLHVNQLLDFALHQPGHRDVGPLADHLGNVLFVDFLFQHALAGLQRYEARFGIANLLLELRHAAILQLRRLRVVAAALRAFHLEPHRLQLLLERACVADRRLLLLPLRRQAPAFFLQVGQFLVEFAEPFDRRLVGLLAQRLALDFELHDAPLDLVEFRRHRVDLHAQLRRCLVHQINRLVGQEAVGDVAVR